MGKENSNGERKVEKLDFQYIFQFFVIAFSVIVCTILICTTLSLKNEVEKLQEENADLVEQTKSLDEDTKLLIEDGVSDKSIEAFNENRGEQTISYAEEPTTLKEAVELMDDRYDDFTSNWSNILMFVSGGLGLLVIIFPFFNYVFLQKDAVRKYEKKMNKLHSRKEDEINDIIEGFEKKFKKDEKELKTSHKEMQDEIEVSFHKAKDANKQIEKSHKKLQKSTQGIDSKMKEWEEKINNTVENAKEQIDKKVEHANKTIDMTNQYVENVSTSDENRATKDIDVEFEDAMDNARVYYLNGTSATHRKNYIKAIEHYTDAIKLNKDFSKAYRGRGDCYALLEKPDYKKAISDYNKAVGLDPNDANAYFKRGLAYKRKENPDYERAIYDERKAIKLAPKDGNGYNNLACSYIELSKIENKEENLKNAEKNIQRAIELDNTIGVYFCTLAEYYYEMGDEYKEQQHEAYKKAIELGHKCDDRCMKCK